MLHRVASLYVLALPLLATANVVPRTNPASQCEPGNLLCCDSVESADSIDESKIISAIVGLGPISAITGLVGITCSPITVGSAAVNPCTAQAVCCSHNFGGVLALDCNPVDLSL